MHGIWLNEPSLGSIIRFGLHKINGAQLINMDLIVLLCFSSFAIKVLQFISIFGPKTTTTTTLTPEMNSFTSKSFDEGAILQFLFATISRRQYNKASLKAIIYENLIPFLHRNAKERKQFNNKFKNAFAEQKLCKIFLEFLKRKLALRQFLVVIEFLSGWFAWSQFLLFNAMSDELNNVSLDLKPATSKCLRCAKLLNFTRTVHSNAVELKKNKRESPHSQH